MVKEDRSKSLLSHKSLLILIKYIPHIIAIAYAIYTFLGIFGIDYNIFGCFFHVSFLTWIILYCLSIVFKYCHVHRLPIYYIGANELITCLDYYLDIELDYFTFIIVSLLMSCILIFGYSYYYLNNLKMRDKKKFYVPKHIKSPLSGDYEVTLNWGDKVYVEKHEFEGKLDKFFKNYLVVANYEEDNHDYSQDYLTFVALEDGIISFNILQSIGTDMITSVSYSTNNGTTWVTTTNQDNKSSSLVIDVNVNTGDKILWKGDIRQMGYFNEMEEIYYGSFFSSTAEFNVQGNIMSLSYGDDFNDKNTLEYRYQFSHLFCDEENGCKVMNAINLLLPATTLTSNCYSCMFQNCTSLITAPELPATTLASSCYSGMFSNCTSLITVPELPATTLVTACYVGMFSGCTSLTVAPELPATTLASSCYGNMFKDCTSLTTVPSILPAITLTDNCYQRMFYGCTALTVAPELPATTLTQYCYAYMFQNCSSLNYIKAMFTTTPSFDTYDWVRGVAASGTFVKNNAAEWDVTGNDGIPFGWDVEEV